MRLNLLPNDVIIEIMLFTEYLSRRHLSRTCRRLYRIAKTESFLPRPIILNVSLGNLADTTSLQILKDKKKTLHHARACIVNVEWWDQPSRSDKIKRKESYLKNLAVHAPTLEFLVFRVRWAPNSQAGPPKDGLQDMIVHDAFRSLTHIEFCDVLVFSFFDGAELPNLREVYLKSKGPAFYLNTVMMAKTLAKFPVTTFVISLSRIRENWVEELDNCAQHLKNLRYLSLHGTDTRKIPAHAVFPNDFDEWLRKSSDQIVASSLEVVAFGCYPASLDPEPEHFDTPHSPELDPARTLAGQGPKMFFQTRRRGIGTVRIFDTELLAASRKLDRRKFPALRAVGWLVPRVGVEGQEDYCAQVWCMRGPDGDWHYVGKKEVWPTFDMSDVFG